MDVLYRGFETTLLVCALALQAALMASAMPDRGATASASVVLPMLSVVADRADVTAR